jgi:hypothetical protein
VLDKWLRCRAHTRQSGTDVPDVRDWQWRGEQL